MQKLKTFDAKWMEEEIQDNPEERKELAAYKKYAKNNQYWHLDDLDAIIARDDVFLRYDNLTAPYIFIAYCGKDVIKAHNKFIDADACPLFIDTISGMNEDEDEDDVEIEVSGFTIDCNRFMPIDECVVLTPRIHSYVEKIYTGNLEFPCIISIWMAAEGYGRTMDGSAVITLKNLGVKTFSELDK